MKIILEISGQDSIQEYEMFNEKLMELLRDHKYKLTVIAEPRDEE